MLRQLLLTPERTMTPVRERRKETGRLNEYPNPLKQATVLGAIKTKPLRVGLPARLDSPCARRLSVFRPGRRKRPFKPNKETGSFEQAEPKAIFLLASVVAIKERKNGFLRPNKRMTNNNVQPA